MNPTTHPPTLRSGSAGAAGSAMLMGGLIFAVLPFLQVMPPPPAPDEPEPQEVVEYDPPPPVPPPPVEADPPESEPDPPELENPPLPPPTGMMDIDGWGIDVAGYFPDWSDGIADPSDADMDLPFDPEDLDEIPRATTTVSPVYPARQRTSGITGTVLLEFVVEKDGRVTTARAIRSNHSDFSSAALTAIRKWKFEPGRKDGAIVRSRVRMPMHFNLQR